MKRLVDKFKKNGFAIGVAIYMSWLFVMIASGLALFWMRMDVYEKSRPERAMESYVASCDGNYWNKMLVDGGLSKEYADKFDVENVSYFKKLESYTDDAPAYSVHLGDREVFSATLKKKNELMFGYNDWDIGEVKLTGSRISIYAPEDAVISIHGEKIPQDALVQKDAQALQLGVFEADSKDIRGLAKYQVNTVYTADDIIVNNSNGCVLDLSESSGTSYYYPPRARDYTITAPADSIVTVNGIALTPDNAKIQTSASKDFAGLEKFVTSLPQQKIYTIEGLVAKPDIVVTAADGRNLEASVNGKEYLYEIPPMEIAPELSRYIMGGFDAYIGFIGGRGGNLQGNYNRYIAYVAPESDAFIRAKGAWASLVWTSGRDGRLKAAQVSKYTQYSDELFTCQIDYTVVNDKTDNANSCLFIYVKYNGAWKVAKILNITSYAEIEP